MGEADNLVIELGDHDAVANDDESLEPWRDGRDFRLVTELPEQSCDRSRVSRQGIPNRQTHAE